MASETHALLRSIRRWTLVIAFLLGVGVVTLAQTGYVLSNYQDEIVFAVAGVAGGTVALAAAVLWLGSFSSPSETGSDE